MATLEIFDSFDHHPGTTFINKWSSSTSANISASGRFGSSALRFVSSGANVTKIFSSAGSDFVVGTVFQTATLAATTIIKFLTGATSQVDLRLTAAGELQVTRNGTQLEITSGLGLLINTYYVIVFKVNIGNSGSWTVWCDGTQVLSGSGDTQNDASISTADRFQLVSSANITTYYDSVYCYSGADATNQGDLRAYAQFPNGAGDNTAWTPSAGNNYDCVNETTPNTTDYVESSTASQKDDYSFAALGIAGVVKAVQVNFYAQKTDAGARSVRPYAERSGTYAYGTTFSLADTYAIFSYLWETDPIAGSAWTVTNLNNTKFGVELVA